jgi:hypothetical protein
MRTHPTARPVQDLMNLFIEKLLSAGLESNSRAKKKGNNKIAIGLK